MRGFVGPADIFRNPAGDLLPVRAAGAAGTQPLRPELATAGDDFAVMGMHFKLGLYEHQSAGAIQGVIDLMAEEPTLLDDPDSLLRRADHDLRAGVQHHRRPGQLTAMEQVLDGHPEPCP